MKRGEFFKTGIDENKEVGGEGLSPPLVCPGQHGVCLGESGSGAVHRGSPEGTDEQDGRTDAKLQVGLEAGGGRRRGTGELLKGAGSPALPTCTCLLPGPAPGEERIGCSGLQGRGPSRRACVPSGVSLLGQGRRLFL